MGRHQQFFKIVACLLIMCLLAQDVSLAAQTQSPSSKPSGQTTAKDSPIPRSLGAIDEEFQGTNGKHITFILDAHDSIEAQQNIVRLIRHEIKERGVQTVFEEGYSGPLNTDDYFGSIHDTEILRKVSYYYLDRLRLGAAEFAHINRKKLLTGYKKTDWKLVGADDKKAYLEDVRAFGDAEEAQKKILRDINSIKRELNELAVKIFSAQAKEWMSARERFQNNTLPFFNYAGRWLKMIPESECPLLRSLLNAKNDPALAENLRAAHVSDLLSELDRLDALILERLFRDLEAKQLWQAIDAVREAEDVACLKAGQRQFVALKQKQKSLNTEKIAALIAKEKKAPVVLSRRWEKSLESALKFYVLAATRDGAVEKALQRWNEKENEGVLVFGGFHRQGITEILRRNGFSYTVIIPKITEPSKRHQALYRKIMRAELQTTGRMPRLPLQAARPLSGFIKNGFVDVARVKALAEKYPGDLPGFALFVQTTFAARGIVGGNLSRPSGSPNTRRISASVLRKYRSETRSAEPSETSNVSKSTLRIGESF